MAEVQSQAPTVPEAERYYAEHVQLDSGTAGSSQETLQESMNKGARQSWRLVILRLGMSYFLCFWCLKLTLKA
jgi:hypothetical protein